MALDLNLLRVFDVLLEERSVTRAAARLGLSQSAVSHALGRLRHQLNDDLFVRGPAGMEPTVRALDIGGRVHVAMNQLREAFVPADFAPASTTRRFTLTAGAYASAVLVPPLVARLAEEAPGAELSVGDYPVELLDLLDARRTDFVVAGVISAPERFAREVILAEELAWVVSTDSPLARLSAVDLEALAATPHVVISRRPFGDEDRTVHRGLVMRSSWEDAGAFDAALAGRGLKRRVAVTVPDTYSALAVARGSHMATLIPRRLALTAARYGGLALIEPPYDSPPVEIALMFLKDRLRDPPIAWLRALVRDVAAAL